MRKSCEIEPKKAVIPQTSDNSRETILLRILAAALLRRAGSAVECVVKDVKEEERDWLNAEDGAF